MNGGIRLLFLIYTTLSWLFICYLFSGLFLRMAHELGRDRSRVINLIWKWSKWPSLAYVVSAPLLDVLNHNEQHWYSSLLYVWNGVVWWLYRDMGDDDDFKKLGKRIKEKVAQMGNKLVVIPAPAGA